MGILTKVIAHFCQYPITEPFSYGNLFTFNADLTGWFIKGISIFMLTFKLENCSCFKPTRK